MVIDYRISDIVPYINWIYFFHAWGLSGKPESEQEKQKQEALRMLEEWEDRYQTHAVVEIVDANSDGDDIIAAGANSRRNAKPMSCRLYTTIVVGYYRQTWHLCSNSRCACCESQ